MYEKKYDSLSSIIIIHFVCIVCNVKGYGHVWVAGDAKNMYLLSGPTMISVQSVNALGQLPNFNQR